MAGALPISKSQAVAAAKWMKSNFTPEMTKAIEGGPVTLDLLCAIACQETAFVWVQFLKTHPPKEIIERCVFDASGDYPGTSRSAFPKNTAAFQARYGAALTDTLIAEANETRAMRGFGPQHWVYKGYGIFQYDLQHIDVDRAFFEQKQWYDMEICARKCVGELLPRYAKYKGDWWKTLKGYNGTGPKAEQYANNVTIFWEYCKGA